VGSSGHKRAYARFKDLLESDGLLEKCYNFEATASDRALRDWCAENDVQIIEQNDRLSGRGHG
jgi:hypothetical protein